MLWVRSSSAGIVSACRLLTRCIKSHSVKWKLRSWSRLSGLCLTCLPSFRACRRRHTARRIIPIVTSWNRPSLCTLWVFYYVNHLWNEPVDHVKKSKPKHRCLGILCLAESQSRSVFPRQSSKILALSKQRACKASVQGVSVLRQATGEMGEIGVALLKWFALHAKERTRSICEPMTQRKHTVFRQR